MYLLGSKRQEVYAPSLLACTATDQLSRPCFCLCDADYAQQSVKTWLCLQGNKRQKVAAPGGFTDANASWLKPKPAKQPAKAEPSSGMDLEDGELTPMYSVSASSGLII